MAGTKKLAPKASRGRGIQVKVKAVDGLPERKRSVDSRQTRYRDAMAQVRKKGKRGGWHEIATYQSPTGAAVVRREMLAGGRLIDGRVGDWDIETRRLHDAAGVVIGSALYVKLK